MFSQMHFACHYFTLHFQNFRDSLSTLFEDILLQIWDSTSSSTTTPRLDKIESACHASDDNYRDCTQSKIRIRDIYL